MPVVPEVKAFFHDQSNTISYVLTDPETLACAIVDPALDFNAVSGRTGTQFAENIAEHVRSQKLECQWILETHAHADHLSAAPFLKSELGGQIGIGEGIVDVHKHFAELFNLDRSGDLDTTRFDRLFKEGDSFSIGDMSASVIQTPGHTPSCVTYLVGDAAFVGDTLFMPDGGTARADFPGGDANTLYESIQRILQLDPQTRVFVCHDYGPGGRDIAWQTSVGDQRENNIHVGASADREKFVQLRTERDATLSLPSLILPAIQVNVRAGNLPAPDDNGISYIRIPLNQL